MKTARSCGISPICGCDQSQRSRHLTQTFADVPHDRRRTVQRGGRNARGHDPRASVRDDASVLAHWQARVDRSSRAPVIIRPRRAWSPGSSTRPRRGRGGVLVPVRIHPGDLALLERAAVGAAAASTAIVTTQPIAAAAPRGSSPSRGTARPSPSPRAVATAARHRLAGRHGRGSRSSVDPSRESPVGARPAGGRGWRAGLSRPPRAVRGGRPHNRRGGRRPGRRYGSCSAPHVKARR